MPAVALRPAALLLAALLLLPAAADADTADGASASASSAAAFRPDLQWELDPYYSNVALELPLTTTPIPDGGRLPEKEVYQQLFRDSLRPRLLMLEASVYPLPVAGTWLRRHQPGMYEDYNVGTLGNNQLNLIDAVTAGFQEPWAVSAFAGSVMQFSEAGQAAAQRNHGYMGYLVSAGAKHIHNNRLIDDNWWELEWKLKGERELGDEDLAWSFRVGLKTHGNPDISDVAYVALRRSSLDYASPWLSLLRNSDMELLTELDRRRGRLLRQEVVIGRKLPLRRYHMALTLEVGAIYEAPEKYHGALADPEADTLTFVLRPHIKF